MKFFPAGSLGRKILALLAGEILFLGIIGGIVSYQVRWVEAKITEMADLKDPSPFTASLISELGTITVNLLGYVQNRDPQFLDRITKAGQTFEISLDDFQKLNPRLFPSVSKEKIQEAYQPFKEVLQATLQACDVLAQAWDQLMTDDNQILYWLTHRLQPLIRAGQSQAAARKDAVMALESQARAFPQDVAQAVLGTSNDPEQTLKEGRQDFEAQLRNCQRLALFAQERLSLRRVAALWGDTAAVAEKALRLEQAKADAFGQMQQAEQALQTTITTVLPAVRPEVIEAKKAAIFRSITWIGVFAGVMLLAGAASLIMSGLWIYRRVRRISEEIRRIAEAAASGDLSREVAGDVHELAGVGQSVNRLIGVLRRSEQMIFQLGSIVESSGDACIGMTLDGKILSWNSGAHRMYGYSTEEVKGRSIDLLFATARDVVLMLEKIKGRKQVALDTTHLRKSRVKIPVHAIVSRLMDSKGELIGVALLCRELPLDSPVSRPAPVPPHEDE